MRILLFILLLASTLMSQDEIIFTSGGILKGEVDRNSITGTTKSIRIKLTGSQQYTFYNVDQINFVRAWNGATLYPVGVVANTLSGFYHFPNVRHLPSNEFQQKFSSDKEAIVAGYLACTACFDTHPKISDYALEKQLVKATILQIQNTNEIMYEHPKLPKLQALMKGILVNWPEGLKGYDYRIQIIRDDQPNALAVAGGNLYFTTGLLQMIETDEELESVLAHEIAHVERRHMLRGFKDYQQNQATLATVSVLLTVGAVLADSDAGLLFAGLVSDIGKFAIEFARIGFGRDQEQEADMFAQIYLSENGKELRPMLSALDKLATHSKTRIGFVPQANAFSSHPNLTARIRQIEKGKFHKYDEPLTMSFFPVGKNLGLQSGFVEMKISHAYKTVSSDGKPQDEILLLGTIVNHHEALSFQVNSIVLNFLGSLGQSPLEGIVEVIVPYDGATEFVGRVRAPKELSEKVEFSVFNKRILPYSVDISAIVLSAGENATKVAGLQNVQCTMTIK
jgi:Zn-dependent protease with chaperone function